MIFDEIFRKWFDVAKMTKSYCNAKIYTLSKSIKILPLVIKRRINICLKLFQKIEFRLLTKFFDSGLM